MHCCDFQMNGTMFNSPKPVQTVSIDGGVQDS